MLQRLLSTPTFDPVILTFYPDLHSEWRLSNYQVWSKYLQQLCLYSANRPACIQQETP